MDDGSPIREQEQLLRIVQTGETRGRHRVKAILDVTENSGKGGAVLHGWRQSRSSRWLAFVDADGAVSANEVYRGPGKWSTQAGDHQKSYFTLALWQFRVESEASVVPQLGRKGFRQSWHESYLG